MDSFKETGYLKVISHLFQSVLFSFINHLIIIPVLAQNLIFSILEIPLMITLSAKTIGIVLLVSMGTLSQSSLPSLFVF